MNRIFIPLANQNNIQTYKYFFNKFRKYNIFLLLDDKITEYKHESIPVMQSLVKIDHIDKFIQDHFNSNEIVAHNVYEISRGQGEIWNTSIASTTVTPTISNIINSILSNSLNFGGIYFLSLEYITIVNHILIKFKKYNEHQHSMQFFITISECFGIKIVAKYLDNILSMQTIDYPLDKSEAYIQGIIEQQVMDLTIKFKSYKENKILKTCIILLVSKQLKELLIQSNFSNCDAICISYEELNNNKDGIRIITKFADNELSKIFSMHKEFLGLNKSIKSLTKLLLYNSLLFKPLGLVSILLVLALCGFKFNAWIQNLDTVNLNKEYYAMADEYRKLKTKYPKIQNVANIADLYSFESVLSIPLPTPFNLMEKFIHFISEDLEFNNISWNLISDDIYDVQSKNINVTVSMHQTYNIEDAKNSELKLAGYINDFSNILKDYKFKITKSKNISFMPKKITIPITISISDNIK